jgi:hypothetical protein
MHVNVKMVPFVTTPGIGVGIKGHGRGGEFKYGIVDTL